ncbi:SLBB domain-containing protein [Glaciecola petra]|uniref:SLBB domain-containing protein n=1 Tax=Glaciecola petra TaxID=3075602 RepID=A0ABU2ZMM4_9ALTE|nr:SLBB domain-containing protein [Aestuariibacter sp. P117]MDT0593660.1 SLBB domain-containing protein [Aestuariibacter sp. P117]
MKVLQFTFISILTMVLLLTIKNVLAQSFVPSAQQIEQFKNLPRSQQEALARQMGFDLSLLDGAQQAQASVQQEEDFVVREVNEEKISEQLAKQSIVEEQTKELKPFGYNLFNARNEIISPSTNTPVPSNYIIGPGDSIQLQVFGKETGSYELVVNSEGNIDLPDLGPLMVAGANFQELKTLVKSTFDEQKIGVNPFVSMGKVRTIQVFLVGEVYRPGPLVVNGLSTVSSALLNSGGVNDIGSLRKIELKRQGKTITTFDLYDLIVLGDTSKDIRLEQGDVLFVPTAKNIVSLDGQIRRPAIYEMLDGESFTQLIDFAGGLLPTADQDSLQLIRFVDDVGLTISNVSARNKSLKKMQIKNGDFLRVPKATLEFSNAILISGAINLPSVLADTGSLKLSNILTEQTLMANSDLQYSIIARRSKFGQKTEIIQFKPIEVLSGDFDLELQAFDELIVFDRIAQNNAGGLIGKVTGGNLRTSQDDLKSDEASFLQKVERNRFTTKVFGNEKSDNFSRRALLAPIISRLKSEASESNPVRLVEITGEVKYPGVYPLAEEFSLSKALNAAGGLTEAAHLESAEVTSIEFNSGAADIVHKRINLLHQLVLPDSQQIKLQSKDVLNIVRIPEWYENNSVELRGEFVFPGTYQISRGETLFDVVKRAGGFTSNASLGAAVFSREELKTKEKDNIDKAVDDLRQELANNNLSNSQFSRTIDYENATKILEDLTSIEPVGRMIIDLEKIASESLDADVELKNGDLLVVPNITPAISIIGEVFVSTTYRYDDSLSLDEYIKLAGGLREYADESKTYIVRANGSVFVPESSFWFSNENSVMLLPGDTIVVPRDVTNYDNISIWQGVTQIIYQTAVAIAAIGSL